MNQTVQTKPLDPGIGFIRFIRAQDDIQTKKEAKAAQPPQVRLFQGNVMLPGHIRAVVQIKGIDRLGHYEVVVKQPPEKNLEDNNQEDGNNPWPILSSFTLPYFNGAMYTEGSMPIGTRKYKVRVIRNPDVDYWLFRLPQVATGAKALSDATR